MSLVSNVMRVFTSRSFISSNKNQSLPKSTSQSKTSDIITESVQNQEESPRTTGGGQETVNGNNMNGNLTGKRRRGRCKWFNVAKGWGFITPFDGGSDVFVHQSVLQMNGFRSLGDNEEVEFECKASDKGFEATRVTGVEGNECKGSDRRPMSKKTKKIRCYNCGEFANHVAAKCNLQPQPKKCHRCKAVEHLIADCPFIISSNNNNTNTKTKSSIIISAKNRRNKGVKSPENTMNSDGLSTGHSDGLSTGHSDIGSEENMETAIMTA